MKKKTVKLVSAVVVLGVACGAYEINALILFLGLFCFL